MLRGVALLARKRAVFSLESKSSLFRVIELFGIQRDEREVAAVMLHMTARAIGLAFRSSINACVVSGASIQAVLNFDVTL